MRSKLKYAACWIAAVAAFSTAGSAFAATSAQGRGYGLDLTASVGTVIGVTAPLGDTGSQTAPLDFNSNATVASADVGVNAGVAQVLSVKTGVISGKTESALAQNKVDSLGQVLDLNINAVSVANVGVLTLKAQSVTAEAHYTCTAGAPLAAGKTSIVGLNTGGVLGVLLATPLTAVGDLLNVPPNTSILNINVPLVAGLSLVLNEQKTTAGKLTVNGLHLKVNVLDLPIVGGGINADVTVAHAEATMPNCDAAPNSVTIAVPSINAANQAAVPVAGQCTAGGGDVAITTSPATSNVSVPCADGTYSTGVNASALPDGPVTFTAVQDGETASTTVTKTTVAGTPVVTVNAPPVINAANANNYGNTPLVSGTCTAGEGDVTVTIGSVSAGTVACSAGGTWQLGEDVNLSSLPDGFIVINATQGTGNGSATAIKDAAAPTVAITTAPSINADNAGSYTFSGSCSENGVPVNVTIGGVASASTPTCTGNQWSVTQSVSGLADGNVVITAAQTDAAGNTTTPAATRTVTKDVTPPILTVTAPAVINATNQNSYSVSGTCTADDGTVTVTIGGLQFIVPCNAGTWTVTGANVGGLPQGSVQITATQTDAAGNVGTGQGTADKTTPAQEDTAPPTVTVVAPAIDAGNQNGYQPSGTCEAGSSAVTVVIGVGLPGAVTTTASCGSDGTWTAPPTDVSGLPQGPVTVTASQSDSSNNTGSAQAETTKSTPAGNPGGPVTPVPVPVPLGGAWASLAVLAAGLGLLRRRRRGAR